MPGRRLEGEVNKREEPAIGGSAIMLDDQAFRQLLDYFDRPWSGYRKVRKGVMKRIRRQI